MASLVCNAGAYTLVGAASATAVALIIAAGSYTLTGSTAGTILGKGVTAVSGSYTVTGTAIQTRRIATEPAGYLLNGSAVTLSKTNRLVFASATGSYALIGTNVQLSTALVTGTGAYAYTGTAATLDRFTLGLSSSTVGGSYSVTGQAVGLLYERPSDSGDYQLTGTTVIFRKGKNLVASAGTYEFIGGTATRLEQSRHFPAASTSYSITGAITTLRRSTSSDYVMVINTDSYVLTGTNSTLRPTRLLTATSGSYTQSGTAVRFKEVAAPGAYYLTGTDVIFRQVARQLTAVSGTYGLSGSAAVPRRSIYNLIAKKGVYLVASPVTTLQRISYVDAGPGQYTIVSPDVFLRSTHFSVESGSYTVLGTIVNLRSSHRGRWRRQSVQPAAVSRQPNRTSTWDTQQGSPGV